MATQKRNSGLRPLPLLASRLAAELSEAWRLMENLLAAIPKDEDWWPDELIKAVAEAQQFLDKEPQS